jgi:hypothetical protein
MRRWPIETHGGQERHSVSSFGKEPGVDQVFLEATAAQLDKNATDSRRNLARTAIRLQNDLSEQK